MKNIQSIKLLLTIITFFCFFSYCPAQSTELGIGINTNHGLLIIDTPIKTINNFQLSNHITHTPGLNTFVSFSSKTAFKFRVNANLNLKQIKLELREQLDQRRRNIEYLNYQFLSADLGFNVSYHINTSKSKWQVYPTLGFSVGLNKLSDSFYGQNVNYAPGEWRNRSYLDIIKDKNIFLYASIIGETIIETPLTLLKRQLEFQSTFHFSPRSFLSNPIDFDPFLVEGQYHYLSFGVNLYLSKVKSK